MSTQHAAIDKLNHEVAGWAQANAEVSSLMLSISVSVPLHHLRECAQRVHAAWRHFDKEPTPGPTLRSKTYKRASGNPSTDLLCEAG